jgi:hypothetical protein
VATAESLRTLVDPAFALDKFVERLGRRFVLHRIPQHARPLGSRSLIDLNEKWEKAGKEGNLVSFHCHTVVWATHYSQLSRCRKRIKPRFRPILGNKSGVRFDALKKAEDVCKALRYQAKMPAHGYRTVPRGWGKKTQTSAKLSYLSRYRLFTALQQYDRLDFWLAGGEGATILRQARMNLNEYRERQQLRSASKSQLQYRSWMSSSGVPRLRAF